MNIKLLREILSRYVSLDSDDDFGIEKCWEEMTIILSDDISATIHYFENECTEEEFYWLGSIFEDIAEKRRVKSLYKYFEAVLQRLLPKYIVSKISKPNICKNVLIIQSMLEASI